MLDFSYEFISVSNPQPHLIKLQFHTSSSKGHLCQHFLFELETCLRYLSQEIQISTIVVESTFDSYPFGPDPQNLRMISTDKFKIFIKRLKNIGRVLCNLPQIIIFDMGNCIEGWFFELSLYSDIRIIQQDGIIKFNHLNCGMLPYLGGLELLSFYVNPSKANALFYLGVDLLASQALDCSLVHQTYISGQQDKMHHTLFENIEKGSSVARIQGKLARYKGLLSVLEHFERHQGVYLASLDSGDWKEWAKSRCEKRDPQFLTVEQFSRQLGHPSPL